MNTQPTSVPAEPLTDRSSFALAIVERAPLAMVTVGGASHIVRDVTEAFCILIGKTKNELVGRPFAETAPGTDECLTRLDRVYRTGKSENYTQPQDAESRTAFSYAMWPVMAGEQPIGVVIQLTEAAALMEKMVATNEALIMGAVHQHELSDAIKSSNELLQVEIIERKLTEAALEQTGSELSDHAGQLEKLVAERTAELTATNQQLEAFIYTIAHDLRAPLRAMEGFSTLLIEEAATALSETSRDYAHRINKSARFMDALLGDLLDFSRISKERVELIPVNLKAVVEAVLSRLRKEIEEKGASVESLGPWPTVRAHAATLSQILHNLTSNALKFARPGVPTRVQLRAVEQADVVRVWVEDNGVGIPPEYQEQIFRLFTRLNGQKYPGTGLGLAIVERGVKRMGGKAGVESTAGQGSRFWFELRKA